jgi:hypothetical protein
MAGPRDYSRSTVMALSHHSGGLCYCPGCPEPVLRHVDGEPRLTVEIAHIRAAYPNGARYDEFMTDDQRRHFRNLILLCNPHHGMADDPKKADFYTVALLTRWKEQREADSRQALSRLREVTPSGLRKMVAEGLARRDSRILEALNRLEDKDQQAAALMRALLDELTEAYSQLNSAALNPHMVADFSEAASTLGDMKGVLAEFTTVMQVTDFSKLSKFNEEY